MSKARKTALNMYIANIREHIDSGDASEHTYRGALEEYIRSFGTAIKTTNEPKKSRHKGQLNRVDIKVHRKTIALGFIETKDIGENLLDAENTKQIRDYCNEFQNFILTNYVDFRRYVRGELREQFSLGSLKSKKLHLAPDIEQEACLFFEGFLIEDTFTVSTADDLADRLAKIARQIRRAVKLELETEGHSKELHDLLKALKKVLIRTMDFGQFSDMFAQTLAYGLFAARVHHDGKSEFNRLSAANIIPKTNPFLKKLFQYFLNDHLPDSVVLYVDETIELLKKTDIAAILEEFSKQGKEDPVVYFYEAFLKAFDAKLRKDMGVYYTPAPIVDYIVRSVDEILQKEFGKKKGIADEKTMIVDPALGTASFLRRVIEVVESRVSEGKWDSYVPEHLLNRIFGFEILMAPYSVAHLKLGLELQKSGYEFGSEDRLGVFLTNTLEETAMQSEALFDDWLSDEARKAARVKRELPIMVVMGNPPYKVNSTNNGDWILKLMRGHDSITNAETHNYYEFNNSPLDEKNPKCLNDDYVKFIRFAQWRVENSKGGIVALITNRSFIDNATFRGMRQSLVNGFDSIYCLDLLSGGKSSKEDENVFDIKQGVCITFFIKRDSTNINKVPDGQGTVSVCKLEGTRDYKFKWLLENSWSTTDFKEIKPDEDLFLFKKTNAKLQQEYKRGFRLPDIFKECSVGIKTSRDEKVIQLRSDEAKSVAQNYSDKSIVDLQEELEISNVKAQNFKKDIASRLKKNSTPDNFSYRPFDLRYSYYTGTSEGYFTRPRREIMNHILHGENLVLAATRQISTSEWRHAFVIDGFPDEALLSNKSKESAYIFPLFLHYSAEQTELEKRSNSNIKPEILAFLKDRYGKTLDPLEVFNYIYAILNSDSFRSRYNECLQRDYARIQFPEQFGVFQKLSKYGRELVEIHLLKDYRLDGGPVVFAKKGEDNIVAVKYESVEQRLYINKIQYFENVTERMFNYSVGTYKVLEKWLEDRIGRTLKHSDKETFEKICASVERTDKIVLQIDKEINANGGWPLSNSKSIGLRKTG